tara:strand:+ start:107 stop:346 length:240 start_codon:yes stop_codon:yes gene_type:complete
MNKLLDQIKIALGYSECPLKKGCPNYGVRNTTCTETRGRILRERSLRGIAVCYSNELVRQQQVPRLEKDGLVDFIGDFF